ncbi:MULTISPECIES: hypothetical protein [unclassified Lentimicrobium]|uniref:hypothetical protein n=1 Tax=unclassified Lentimicrobium TaxID=2677434 RepID=UPI001556095C|nr:MULTISPECIES: hypothetical protein [unclassified Lentimicrobium]NPD45558.1 hypothetical protein [Lentimicrobium sp. S6]NPD83637.1 hypothetical protein [Lentimicrobium sp. L6]
MPDFKTFYISLAKVVLVLFIVTAPILYFNIIVDPYGVFFGNYRNSKLEPNKRYMKMKHVLNSPDRYHSFIFGSSRVNALNPARINNSKYYNMTYSAGIPKAHYQDICNLISHGVKIENLLISLDFEGILYGVEASENDLLRKKPPSTFIEKIKFFQSYIFYLPSWNYINLFYTKGSPLIDRSLVFENGITYNSFFESLSNKGKLAHNSSSRFLKPSGARKFPSRLNITIKEIENIVNLAKEHEINIQFFINPVHATTILNLDLERYYRGLEMLSELTDFYDFSDLNSITTNNLNYFETSHFTQGVGDLVIARIFNQYHPQLPNDFGRKVSKLNIIDHIEHHKAQVKRYFHKIEVEDYISPIYEKSDYLNSKDSVFWSVDALNGIGNAHVQKPFVHSIPLLQIAGRAIVKDFSNKPKKVFIKINEQYFEACKVKECDSLGLIWKAEIKTNLLQRGIQNIELALLIDNKFVFGEGSEEIYVMPNQVSVNNLEMTSGGESAEFVVDNIGGQNGNYILPHHKENFLEINGWVKNETGQNPMNNVFVSIADKEYPIQFVNPRKDVVDRYEDNSLMMSGWSVKIPIHFDRGCYDIDFKVVNKDKKSFWVPENKYTVRFIEAHSKELLADLIESPMKTRYVIDNINRANNFEEAVEIKGESIEIRGWAVDDLHNSSALGMVIRIGEKYFPSDYGLPRADVAKAFTNQEFEFSGWNVIIPTKELEEGEYELSVYILSKDETTYYKDDTNYKIKIEK